MARTVRADPARSRARDKERGTRTRIGAGLPENRQRRSVSNPWRPPTGPNLAQTGHPTRTSSRGLHSVNWIPRARDASASIAVVDPRLAVQVPQVANGVDGADDRERNEGDEPQQHDRDPRR